MQSEPLRARRTPGTFVRQCLTPCAAALVLAVVPLSSAGAGAQDDKDNRNGKDKGRRPSLTLKASPSISFSPARIVVTAELRGGADAEADLYCPAVEWEWGDGTRSESAEDCEPFEAGRSEVKRRWTTTHTYTMGGNYRVLMRLKRDGRSVASGNTTVQVRPGVREGFEQP